tara:strand:- start:779 stop:1051 length:273 start_codon:yes stop_codon:yes gene_type:complete
LGLTGEDMKFNFAKDQSVYYVDWQDGNKKIPAVIKNTRRTRADVYLKLEGLFKWELTDVPMEDLEATNDFTTKSDWLIGRALIWNDQEAK